PASARSSRRSGVPAGGRPRGPAPSPEHRPEEAQRGPQPQPPEPEPATRIPDGAGGRARERGPDQPDGERGGRRASPPRHRPQPRQGHAGGHRHYAERSRPQGVTRATPPLKRPDLARRAAWAAG